MAFSERFHTTPLHLPLPLFRYTAMSGNLKTVYALIRRLNRYYIDVQRDTLLLLYSPLAYWTIRSVKLTRTMCACAGQKTR